MIVSTIGLLLPSISSELRLSPAQQGLLGSAAFWGNIALTLPFGWLASRLRPKPLTTATLAIGTACLVLQGWAPVFSVLILGRLAFGISIIAREPARALLIHQWFPPREAILANSISSLMFGLVVGSGLVATPLILEAVAEDWRLVLRIFGALFAALTAMWIVLGRERHSQTRGPEDGAWGVGLLRSALSHRDLWIGGGGFIGATLVWSAFLNFYPTMMLEVHGLPLRWSGALLAIGIFVGGISGLGLSYSVMNFGGRRTVLQFAGAAMTVSYAGMTLTDSIPLLLPLSVLNGVAWGMYPVLYTVPFHLPGIRPREIVVSVSALMTMIAVGTGTGPVVAGLLQETVGDLSRTLLIMAFAPLSLLIAGTALRSTSEPGTRSSRDRGAVSAVKPVGSRDRETCP